jgi:hypothetical protein
VIGALALAAGPASPQGTPVPTGPAAPAPAPVPQPTMVGDFANLPARQLTHVQVKLTYTGPQKKVLPTVVFGSYQTLPAMAAFVPFRTPGVPYDNDEVERIDHFSTALSELKSMLLAANTLPPVQSGSRTGDTLSLMVVDTAAGHFYKGTEVILDRAAAKALVSLLAGSADPGNGMARQVLGDFLARL